MMSQPEELTTSDMSYFQEFTRKLENITVTRLWGSLGKYLAEDIAFLPPGHPRVIGRDEVIQWFNNFPTLINCESTIDLVQGGPNCAWVMGTVVMTIETEPGKRLFMKGKWSSTWRKYDFWVCTSNMWNADHPLG